MSKTRRQFLSDLFSTAGTVSLAVTFSAFNQRSANGFAKRTTGYGPLNSVEDRTTGLPLLNLPAGFEYLSYGWSGDAMDDGRETPLLHDGMAVVSEKGGLLTLVRNHECNNDGNPIGDPNLSYDAHGPAGCTNLIFDSAKEKFTSAWVSLSGTCRNCAGGPTPWGTWLTCEETVYEPGTRIPYREEGKIKSREGQFQKDHGWIFEVDATGVTKPEPLKDMGRFVHEAIAFDRKTGYVYETEDRPISGFYRFIPNTPNKLSDGGKLSMMKVVDHPFLIRDLNGKKEFDVEWVDIPDPHRGHRPETKNEMGVILQGQEQGATAFARLEGCWADEEHIYFDATTGGDQKMGQIWRYKPSDEKLILLFESPSKEVLNMPDNLCVHPQGGMLLCEDGSNAVQRIHGLTVDGELFTFAANNIVLSGERNGIRGDFRKREWAGVCFSPDGKWLFVNAQSPGITFAITGPWKRGPLG